MPELDFELVPDDGNRSGPQAEFAWPDFKIAILSESQLEDAGVFQSHGWEVLQWPVDLDGLTERIRSLAADL